MDRGRKKACAEKTSMELGIPAGYLLVLQRKRRKDEVL